MKRWIVTCALIATLALPARRACAEGIDVFTGASLNGKPNVLFIIDNTANWNTAFTNEMAALSAAFTSLPVNRDGTAVFNVGIMFTTETGSPNSNVSGGYVRAAIRPMTTVNKALYAAMITQFDKLKDKGNAGYSALEMAEAYLYFQGGTPYAGNGKVKTDFTGNRCIGCNLTAAQITANNAVFALPGNALASESATSYVSPQTAGCIKNFIIYISNGPNQESNSVDSTANTMLHNAGGDITQIPVSPAGSATNPSDEWARFMKQSTLGVVTYTIDVLPPTTGQGPGWTALLKSMSSVSSGKYQSVLASGGTASVSDISKAITNDLSEIQAVNSVYAAVSLPASTNTQGSYLNQVYIGMFRPDPNANPRWMGNLKQYQMGFSGTALIMEDADSKSAINSQTGFITECARSFWTPKTVDTYWTFFPEGNCLPPAGSPSGYYQNSNYPDGNVVEKGGEGYLLRSQTARTMYTCPPTFSACSTGISNLPYFDTNNAAITPALLGVTTSAQATSLIQFERGLDVLDENTNGITTTEMRPSAHGDVIHSHPAVINYGTDTSPQVVVYYGGNDGAFRAVNGNQTGNVNGVPPGGELWSFVPPEFWGGIQRLYNNSPLVTFPNITAGATQPKAYGIDGPISFALGSSSAWLYAPMRRGGRALYAFDVSNSATPRLLWKVGCPSNIPEPSGPIDDTGCKSGFTGIGQTWSSAKIIKAAGYGGGGSPLIVMGGGYDTCEDNDPNTCTSSTKGNKVYVLDASSGTLLNTFSTVRAVVADVAIVPDASGQAVYGYVVDLGGNVYRITIGSNTPANWTMSQIASLGCANSGSCTANRKFMFAPDVVYQNGMYTLLVGSGDREKPLLYTALGTPVGSVVNSVTNYFFAIEDNPTSSTWLSSESGNCGSAIICLNSLLGVTSSTPATPGSLLNKKGWYLGLTVATEQVVTAAITIYGTVYFSTHQPAVPQALSCSSSLGTTRLYTVPFTTPMAVFSVLPPVGLPPSPTAGLVTVLGPAGEVTVPFCIGCSPESPLQSTEPQAAPGTVPTQPKARVYWYIQR